MASFAISVPTFAQQTVTIQDMEYNIFYGQDAPWIGDKSLDKKLAILDNQYKAYEKAAEKNKTAEMTKLKQSILVWRSQNENWIKDLDQHNIMMIDKWINTSNQNLRINDK